MKLVNCTRGAVYVLATAFLAFIVLFNWQGGPLGQLGAMITIFLLLIAVAAFVGITTAYRNDLPALHPLYAIQAPVVGIAAGVICLGFLSGPVVRQASFTVKRDVLNSAVAQVSLNELSDKWNRLEALEPITGTALVRAKKESSGTGMIVEFHTKGGFPLKRFGFLYASSPHGKQEAEQDWRKLKPLAENWWEFRD